MNEFHEHDYTNEYGKECGIIKSLKTCTTYHLHKM